MKNETKWYKNPDVLTKILVLFFLVGLGLCLHFCVDSFFDKTVALLVSGDVNALAEYIRSFGSWAIVVSFLLDVFINAASVLPSIFLSTANGLIFGLPLGILISWLAETTGVVISFFLMRYFFRGTAEKIISTSNSLKNIDEASGRKGLQWMAIARAMPYFPSGILTAIGAVSRISAKDYIIANLIGKFPSTALEVVIGHDLVNFEQHSMRLAILVCVIALLYIVYLRYKKCCDKKKD